MHLYRVFDWDRSSLGRGDGGPLFVARRAQGAGRHDNPSQYGAWYCARQRVSAVAESLQRFRGQTLEDGDFVRSDGRIKALVSLEIDDDVRLVDLDDPEELVRRRLRPSHVATLRRDGTQPIASAIFTDGACGLSWWSTIDANWTNVTLFHERALPLARVAGPPLPLSTREDDVRAAAVRLSITLEQ